MGERVVVSNCPTLCHLVEIHQMASTFYLFSYLIYFRLSVQQFDGYYRFTTRRQLDLCGLEITLKSSY